MRLRHIVIVACVGIVFLALFLSKRIGKRPEAPSAGSSQPLRLVQVDTVQLTSQENSIDVTGNLKAVNRTELFAEVSGTVISTKPFLKGTSFGSGEVMLQLDDKEERLSLVSQKVNLFNQITRMLPDFQELFPDNYSTWKAYLQNFDENKPLAPLPKTTSEKERFYVSNAGVISSFYAIQSAQQVLGKHLIKAPFSGTLTESQVQLGSLVRSGQKLGTLVGSNTFELESAVSIYQVGNLKKGTEVNLISPALDKEFSGTIKRMGNQVDQRSQMVYVSIDVSGQGLYDGLFMEGRISQASIDNAVDFDRSLLLPDNKVFVVQGDSLVLYPIEPLAINENAVVTSSLKEGTILLNEASPNFYPGMKVRLTP